MKRDIVLKPEFVNYIPDALEEGTLYVSMEFATASHKCVCGCGLEVVTPFSPDDWKLTFDGRTVSLSPSVGNWSFPCESHYFIIRNEVKWAPKWSRERIQAGRESDQAIKETYYSDTAPAEAEDKPAANVSFWKWIKSKFWG